MTRHVHFVGFRGDEFNRACRIWKPDFIHLTNDHRSEGDIGEDDIVIFANKAREGVKSEFSWQDHENW